MPSMLFQRKQVLPLILILILVLGAQATTIAASRVLRERNHGRKQEARRPWHPQCLAAHLIPIILVEDALTHEDFFKACAVLIQCSFIHFSHSIFFWLLFWSSDWRGRACWVPGQFSIFFSVQQFLLSLHVNDGVSLYMWHFVHNLFTIAVGMSV